MSLVSAQGPRARRNGRPRPPGAKVAVTGATGTVGRELVPLLTSDRRIGAVLGLGREESSAPETRGYEFRRVDLRDASAVARSVEGADAVVHLGFALPGLRFDEDELFRINVEGTASVARAALDGGARRFVYASSGVVYGFRPENPDPITEDLHVRASARHFYARHKAQTEFLLDELFGRSDADLYVLRPCAIVGPDAAGAALHPFPGTLPSAVRGALRVAGRAGLAPALPAPPVPLQFVHAADVAAAVLRCVHGQGPPGVYNLAGRDAVDGPDVLRTLGLRALPLPRWVTAAAARTIAALPPVVPATGWSEALTQPLMLDTTKARRKLGWRPRYTSAEALRATRPGLGL